MDKREQLEKEYIELGNELPTIHTDLDFENHCYWRMAADNVVGDKWKRKVMPPFYKHCSLAQLDTAVNFLKMMREDYFAVKALDANSKKYRKNIELSELFDDIDDFLAKEEDTAHGEDGDHISDLRSKINYFKPNIQFKINKHDNITLYFNCICSYYGSYAYKRVLH